MSAAVTGTSQELLAELAAAHNRLSAVRGAVEPVRFADNSSAMAWVTENRAALIALATEAADAGRPEDATQIADHLLPFLLHAKDLSAAGGLAAVCLSAARDAGHRGAEGLALLHLGDICLAEPTAGDPIGYLRTAIEILTEADNVKQAASARLSLGIALSRDDTRGEAHAILSEVAVAYADLGDRSLEATALLYQATNLRVANHSANAVTAARRAVEIFREIGDGGQEAAALIELGMALKDNGDGEGAIRLFAQAAEIAGAREKPGLQAIANYHLGAALVAHRRFEEAVEPLRFCANRAAEQSHDHLESTAAALLGTAFIGAGHYTDAVWVLRRALAAAPVPHSGVRRSTHRALGIALVHTCQFAEAVEPLRDAAAMYGAAGDTQGQALTLRWLEAAQKGLALRAGR
jgi:tetratricopeptide (TPR) repeat protein